MSNPNTTQEVRELIHDTVDSTTRMVQKIHQTIANAPFDTLEMVDALEQSARDLRETQDMVVSAVYDTVRKINRKTQRLGDELLG
jgi:hypothetical protein